MPLWLCYNSVFLEFYVNFNQQKENLMANVFHFIKIAVAVITGVAAAVCLFVAMPYVTPLAVTSLAFSQMPE